MENKINKIIENSKEFSYTSSAINMTYNMIKFPNGCLCMFGSGKFLKDADEGGYIGDYFFLQSNWSFVVKDNIYDLPRTFIMINRNASQILQLASRLIVWSGNNQVSFAVWTENESSITVDIPFDFIVLGRWKS